MPLSSATVDQLTVRDERPLREMAVYAAIRRMMVRDAFSFRVAKPGENDWSRVLFLNLTFWNAGEASDVLTDASIDADVLAHAGWHHAARKSLSQPNQSRRPTPGELFLGESVASAFDLYLAGWLLQHGKRSSFLKTQVPAMAQAAENAGMDADSFATLLASVATDPEQAFEDLRALLFDAAMALLACRGVDEAAAALTHLAPRRFSCLLHHYELSNWLLYARAYAEPPHESAEGTDAGRETDRALRAAPVSLHWLEKHWLG